MRLPLCGERSQARGNAEGGKEKGKTMPALYGDIRITLDAKRDYDGVHTWAIVKRYDGARWRKVDAFKYDASKVQIWIESAS